jgi:hypothetical protein
MIDRRTLLKAGLGAAPLAGMSFADTPSSEVNWQRKIRRVGQLNMGGLLGQPESGCRAG